MNGNFSNSFPSKIAILYSDAKREYFPTEQQYISEAEVKPRSETIRNYLNNLGIQVQLIAGDKYLSENLQKFNPDFAINLVDSVYGKEYLSPTIPATLELLQIPYTGSTMLGLSINANKFFTKKILEQHGITTPKYQLLTDPNQELDPLLDVPLIMKLNEIHGSIEISSHSILHEEKDVEKQAKFLIETYNQPVLIEEFIAGKEVSVIILEGLNTKVYSAQKIFHQPNEFQIISFDDNWGEHNTFHYEKYELPTKVKENLKLAFEVLKMDDYAKFDLRIDSSGRHFIIDCNANNALGPSPECAIGNILKLYDIDFEEILIRLIKNTLKITPNQQLSENEH